MQIKKTKEAARYLSELTSDAQSAKEELEKGKQELADRLLTFLTTQQKEAGMDLANSFLLLAGQERSLWEQYREEPAQYLSDLKIRLFVE